MSAHCLRPEPLYPGDMRGYRVVRTRNTLASAAPGALRQACIVKPFPVLQRTVRAYRLWRNRGLVLALAFSLFLHAAVIIVLAPTAGVPTGAGQGPTAADRFYAVLKSSPAAAETAASLPAHDEPATVHVPSDTSLPPQSRSQAQAIETKQAEPRPVSEDSPDETAKLAAEPSLPPAPGYRYGIGLHRQPRLLNEIMVNYPPAAGAREGSVTLRILVSETGAIDNLAILRANPKGFFEEAALNAFALAQFAPGEFLGVPVKSQFFVEVEFMPISRAGLSGKGY
jgi:periplasmic protein TonB